MKFEKCYDCLYVCRCCNLCFDGMDEEICQKCVVTGGEQKYFAPIAIEEWPYCPCTGEQREE